VPSSKRRRSRGECEEEVPGASKTPQKEQSGRYDLEEDDDEDFDCAAEAEDEDED